MSAVKTEVQRRTTAVRDAEQHHERPKERHDDRKGERTALVDALQQQIRRLEGGTAGRQADGEDAGISTGSPELDALLPARGLAVGTVTEWLTPGGGYGAGLLALQVARRACEDGGALVVIDTERTFYPPAAVAWGMAPQDMIVLRPPTVSQPPNAARSPSVSRSSLRDRQDLLWAVDQALRCPAVAAVWGALPQPVEEHWLRRFQLSAEESGAMGLFIRPLTALAEPAWADVRWVVGSTMGIPHAAVGEEATCDAGFDRLIPLQLARVRHGVAGVRCTVRIDFTSGEVREVWHERDKKRLGKGRMGRGPVGGQQPAARQPGAALPGGEKKHPRDLAAVLAHPTPGRRQRRA